MQNTTCTTALNAPFTLHGMGESEIRRALEIASSKGWTQSEFARRLGHDSNQRLTNWKSRGMPSKEYQHVAAVLEITIDELLGKKQRSAPATPHSMHVLCVTQAELEALDDNARQIVMRLIATIKGAVKGGDAESRPKPVRKS